MREFTLWLIRGGLIYIGRSEDLKILEKSEIKSFKNQSRISLFLLSRIREFENYSYLSDGQILLLILYNSIQIVLKDNIILKFSNS